MEEIINPEVKATPDMMMLKGSGNWWKSGILIVGLLLAISIAYAGWQFSQKQIPLPSSTPNPVVQSSPTPTPDPTANWKTYTDNQIGYTIKYPPDTIPSRGNCDSFILPATEEERKKINSIRSSGIEIGYTVKGLELAFCVINNPNELGLKDFATKHTPNTDFESINLNNYEAVRGISDNFVEYFIISPDDKLIRIWYNFGKGGYQNTADQILSTFKFLQ